MMTQSELLLDEPQSSFGDYPLGCRGFLVETADLRIVREPWYMNSLDMLLEFEKFEESEDSEETGS